jgi:LasA protease
MTRSMQRNHSAASAARRPAPPTIAVSLAQRLALAFLMLASALACARTPAPEEPTATASGTSGPGLPESLAALSRTPAPTPTPAPYVHFVQASETLDYIAATYDCSTNDIILENSLQDPNALHVGQRLVLPSLDVPVGPSTPLLPDSEFVYGPSDVGFDVESFCRTRPGYLNSYEELVGTDMLNGPQIVELTARRYSVSPRLLLAMIEFESGWLDNPNPSGWASEHPLGATGEGQITLLYQLAWAADQMNKGYYDWKGRGRQIIDLLEGQHAQYDPDINAGTAAVQSFLAYNATWEEWQTICGEGPDSFLVTYRGLFGDPFEGNSGPSLPSDLTQPDLRLPWETGLTWYLTGGPHGAWNEGSGWAAVDFITPEELGCQMSAQWAVASAPGLVVRSDEGVVVIDLDGDGHEETGWNLFYMHVATEDRVPSGTRVDEGQRIGHPSCEGGYSTATHLHFARKYDGEWIPADGSCPLVLSGWTAHGRESYEGTMTRGEEVRTACECREDEINGLTAE